MQLKISAYAFLLNFSNILPAECAFSYGPHNVGSFANPAAARRPFFRYWLPDASVHPDLVAQDVAEVGRIGAGGFEFLPFYNYGGEVGKYPKGADWSTYGFGSPAFQELFRRALQAHEENGLVMDFAIGPNQGQGVPAQSNDDGLQVDLVPFATPFETFLGQNSTMKLPGWGTGQLVAAVCATVISIRNVTNPPVYTELTISNGSLREITSQVNENGRIRFENASELQKPGSWLFTFYEARTSAKNVHFPTESHTTIFDHGSYTVDHFSGRGAETLIHFWEENILTNGIDKLISRVGNYAWEDSLEISANIMWTRKYPEIFKAQHGYNIRPFLPLIMWGNNNINIQKTSPGQYKVLLDTADKGSGYVNAYRATLQRCYQEYLSALSKWAKDRLRSSMSAQVSYNMPMDAAASVPYVDIPECESLQWMNNIDGYRQFTGAANLAGRQIVSNELGAEFLQAFSHTLPALLRSVNAAFAGGINRIVIHGYTFAHEYFETTWPGYTAWQYVVSEAYSNKHPSFQVGMREALDYIGRTQHVLQSGIARIDIAVYNKVSASNYTFPTLRNSSDLMQIGYTYNYVTSENFDLSNVQIKNQQLAPHTSAFKALVISQESKDITYEAADHLINFAKQDFPIIIEDIPNTYPMHDDAQSFEVVQKLENLYQYSSVRRCRKGEIVKALELASVLPRVVTNLNDTVNTVWRDDEREDISYLYVLAEDGATFGTIKVAEKRYTYIFDAWSGKITALLHYTKSKKLGEIEIPLNLAHGESIIFAFSKRRLVEIDYPDIILEKLPLDTLGYEFSKPGGLFIHLPHSQTRGTQEDIIALSNGSESLIDPVFRNAQPAFELEEWSLEAEHWEAPMNINDANDISTKRNTSHQLRAPLRGWLGLGGELANASGVGYYNSSFNWIGNGAHDGAYLTLTEVLHAVRVFVNGYPAPPVDPRNPTVNLGPHLRNGKNNLTLVVPTTMWNYLRSIQSQIKSSGEGPLRVVASEGEPRILPAPANTENGLVGKIILTPYRRYHVGP